MATASLQLPWASSTEPSLSSPTNGATVSAGDNPPQVRLDTPLSAPIGAPSQTEAAPTATPDKAFPAPDGAIVERVITQQASTQAPSQPSGRTVDALALMARGDALFRTGDVVAARLFYERAVDAGNPAAAIRLGETFDPSFLAQAQLRGVRGDPAAAIKWYTRARELGASEADTLVTSIERK